MHILQSSRRHAGRVDDRLSGMFSPPLECPVGRERRPPDRGYRRLGYPTSPNMTGIASSLRRGPSVDMQLQEDYMEDDTTDKRDRPLKARRNVPDGMSFSSVPIKPDHPWNVLQPWQQPKPPAPKPAIKKTGKPRAPHKKRAYSFDISPRVPGKPFRRRTYK